MNPDTQNQTKPSDRCFQCRKKVGLMPFVCRCEHTFCVQHRVDVTHNCSYNYGADLRKTLSTTLEKVIGKKVEVI